MTCECATPHGIHTQEMWECFQSFHDFGWELFLRKPGQKAQGGHLTHTGRVQQGEGPQEGEAADQGNFSQVCPCLFSTGWPQMDPGEDGEVEAQRRLHQWLCHERRAIAMALVEVQHHTLPGARRPREQSRPSTLLEDCQSDTMILVPKVEVNDFPSDHGGSLSLSSVSTCLHKFVAETRDSFVPQFPVDVAMHVDILERVFECSAQPVSCASTSGTSCEEWIKFSSRTSTAVHDRRPAHQVGGEKSGRTLPSSAGSHVVHCFKPISTLLIRMNHIFAVRAFCCRFDLFTVLSLFLTGMASGPHPHLHWTPSVANGRCDSQSMHRLGARCVAAFRSRR